MATTYNDFLGEGGTGTSVAKPYDPDDEPNPNNPGGISNNRLKARQAQQRLTQRVGDPSLGYGGSAEQQAAARASNSAAVQYAPTDNSLTGIVKRGIGTVGNIVKPLATPAAALVNPGLAASALLTSKTGEKLNASPAPVASSSAASVAPQFQAQPGATVPGTTSSGGTSTFNREGQSQPAQPAASATPTTWAPAATDYSGYDQQAARLEQLQTTFLDQLGRLSQADPFGNQAALQKATDRAVSQAAGTAAGVRGGAAAQAGAQQQAIGIQAQTAARGAQDVIAQRRQDEIQATSTGLQAISGAASIGTQLTQNELAKADQGLKSAELNLRAYLGGRELDQKETDSLRQLSTEFAKIDMERYKTDVGYQQSVNDNLTRIYQADTALQGLKYQTDAGENLSADEWLMGLLGAGAGVASGVATSDERAKTNIRRPSTRALREFVERGEGKLYEYREPEKPGRRHGENFGPMAQDLARSEIGRTLVAPDRDGVLRVDTARLALADHSALTHLAKRLNRLEKGGRRGRK